MQILGPGAQRFGISRSEWGPGVGIFTQAEGAGLAFPPLVGCGTGWASSLSLFPQPWHGSHSTAQLLG